MVRFFWVLGSEGCVKSSSAHDRARQHLFFFKKKKKTLKESTCTREVEDPQTTFSHCLIAMKRAILLGKPMSLWTP